MDFSLVQRIFVRYPGSSFSSYQSITNHQDVIFRLLSEQLIQILKYGGIFLALPWPTTVLHQLFKFVHNIWRQMIFTENHQIGIVNHPEARNLSQPVTTIIGESTSSMKIPWLKRLKSGCCSYRTSHCWTWENWHQTCSRIWFNVRLLDKSFSVADIWEIHDKW
jgi:hypothetical protein